MAEEYEKNWNRRVMPNVQYMHRDCVYCQTKQTPRMLVFGKRIWQAPLSSAHPPAYRTTEPPTKCSLALSSVISGTVITGSTQQNLFDQIHQMSFDCQTQQTLLQPAHTFSNGLLYRSGRSQPASTMSPAEQTHLLTLFQSNFYPHTPPRSLINNLSWPLNNARETRRCLRYRAEGSREL